MVLEVRAEAAELSRRLEDDRTVTRLGQEVRRREPGDAAADDADAQRPPATVHETQGWPLVGARGLRRHDAACTRHSTAGSPSSSRASVTLSPGSSNGTGSTVVPASRSTRTRAPATGSRPWLVTTIAIADAR